MKIKKIFIYFLSLSHAHRNDTSENIKIILHFLLFAIQKNNLFYTMNDMVGTLLDVSWDKRKPVRQSLLDVLSEGIQKSTFEPAEFLKKQSTLHMAMNDPLSYDLILLLLEKDGENAFNYISPIVENNKLTALAQLIQKNQSRFSVKIPEVILNVAQGVNKTQLNLNNSNPIVPKPTTASQLQLLIKKSDLDKEYYTLLEEFFDRGWETLPYESPGNHYLSLITPQYRIECSSLLENIIHRYQNGSFNLESVCNKSRLLDIALFFSKETFALAIAKSMSLTCQDIAWMAIKSKNLQFLKLALAEVSVLDPQKRGNENFNWLHQVTLYGANTESLQLILSKLDESQAKVLINEKTLHEDTPAHYIVSWDPSELEKALPILIKLGASFLVKNRKGYYPTQIEHYLSAEEKRKQIFTQNLIPFFRALPYAITSNDCESFRQNLKICSKEFIKEIVICKNYEHSIKVPILKPKPELGGGMYWSERRPYLQLAIYNGHHEIIAELVNLVILNPRYFEIAEAAEILKMNLEYAENVIRYKQSDTINGEKVVELLQAAVQKINKKSGEKENISERLPFFAQEKENSNRRDLSEEQEFSQFILKNAVESSRK